MENEKNKVKRKIRKGKKTGDKRYNEKDGKKVERREREIEEE